MSDIPLNSGQQAVADNYFNFLFSDQKELCISGPGGVGKTFLMGRLIDQVIPRYYEMCTLMGIPRIYDTVSMTATTNKAAEVLGHATGRPTETLHSLLRVTVYNDFSTGKTKIKKKRDWAPIYNRVVFIDESSMLDTTMRKITLETLHKCKIIYVGDHCQLAPIDEAISPIYKDNLPFFELTQPMRNADQPALMAVCQQLRETVKTGAFRPIQVVPGVIDHMDEGQMLREVHRLFMDPSNQDRILCYTNDKVNRINEYIRRMRGMPSELTVGEYAVNNSAVVNEKMSLKVEEEFLVEDIGGVEKHEVNRTGAKITVRYCTLVGRHGVFREVPVPVNRSEVAYWTKHFQGLKDWENFFYIKNNFPDLRPRDACTVHKAQGSSHQTVLIDLGDISTCYNRDTVARMLYVAFSRARSRVILFGNLDSRYGGLTR